MDELEGEKRHWSRVHRTEATITEGIRKRQTLDGKDDLPFRPNLSNLGSGVLRIFLFFSLSRGCHCVFRSCVLPLGCLTQLVFPTFPVSIVKANLHGARTSSSSRPNILSTSGKGPVTGQGKAGQGRGEVR